MQFFAISNDAEPYVPEADEDGSLFLNLEHYGNLDAARAAAVAATLPTGSVTIITPGGPVTAFRDGQEVPPAAPPIPAPDEDGEIFLRLAHYPDLEAAKAAARGATLPTGHATVTAPWGLVAEFRDGLEV